MKIKCSDKINGKQSHIYHFGLVRDSKRKIQINNSYHVIVNDLLEIKCKDELFPSQISVFTFFWVIWTCSLLVVMPSLLLDTKSCSLTLGGATMTLGTTVFLVSFIIWSYDKKKIVVKFYTASNKTNKSKLRKEAEFLPSQGHFHHTLIYHLSFFGHPHCFISKNSFKNSV